MTGLFFPGLPSNRKVSLARSELPSSFLRTLMDFPSRLQFTGWRLTSLLSIGQKHLAPDEREGSAGLFQLLVSPHPSPGPFRESGTKESWLHGNGYFKCCCQTRCDGRLLMAALHGLVGRSHRFQSPQHLMPRTAPNPPQLPLRKRRR